MFNGVFNFFAQLLSIFYDFAGNYAGAIAILTVAVNLVLAPLTLKATRSSIELQRWSPEIKKLQKLHSDDREAQSQAMMEFYKERGINPLGGCLPQLVQAPIFIVLYNVMRGLFRRSDGEGSNFDPKYLDSCCPESALNDRLEESDKAVSLGLDLSRTPLNVLQDNIIEGLPYLALIGMVAVTGWYQHRQIQGRNPNAGAMNPQQQQILKYLPFLLPIFSFSFPTGLVVYFVIGNLFRVTLQSFITWKYYGGDAFALPEGYEALEDVDDETDGKSGGAKNAKKTASSAKAKAGANGTKSGTRPKNASGKTANTSSSNGRRSGASAKGGSRHGRMSNSASSGAPRRPTRPSNVSKSSAATGSDGASSSRRGGGRVTPQGTTGTPNRKKRKKR